MLKALPDHGSDDDPVDPSARSMAPREARVTTLLLIGKLICHQGETLCRIRNLSNGGLMAEVHSPLAVGDPVQVELKVGDRLSGQVRWTRDGHMGLAFDTPIEVSALLGRTALRSGAQGRVRGPRFELDCPVILRTDRHRFRARLLNLSQGGARLEAECALRPDQILTLAIPGLPARRGGVRWAKDGTLGLAFVEPLSFDELGLWLAKR